ncbi:hypothetical protein BO78DRAFT_307832, partial [Aspergillus sclerotiicarbonarius CBS 121057]
KVKSPKPRKQARRRNRTIHSCLECRRREMKCDREQPCVGCRATGQRCIYVSSANGDAQFRRRLAQMKDAKEALDEGLVKESDNKHLSSEECDDLPDDGYLEPTRLAIQDAAYAPDAEDRIDDLGIRLGRMRLGERIGGLYRPRIADELAHSLLHRNSAGSRHVNSAPLKTSSPRSSEEYLKPGRSFTAPSVNLVLGRPPSNESLIDFLPARYIADTLLERYWIAVHPVARIMHRPTFAQRYETLWELVDNGHEIIPSLGAIVYAVLFSAVVSMEDKHLDGYGVSHQELKDRLQMGTETALCRAQLLTSTKTETLQAFVGYILPMGLGEVSRAHSDLVGMVIRSAECQIRRLIWYQICYLDLRTSEIQGPRPFIQPDGYTTQLPLNAPLPVAWNDMVLSMICFECQEMHRHCLTLRNCVDQKRISLTKAIAELETFRETMDKKYGPLIENSSPQQPIQRMAGLVLKLMVSLLYICLLHRYMNSVSYRIPNRLRQIVLSKGTDALEAAVDLESEDLHLWSWYSSSYHQYHVAFLLLCEVFAFPLRKEATRIWRCLDFVFAEPLTSLAGLIISETPTLQEIIDYRNMKGRHLITMISERMHVYQAAKGLRQPSNFDDSMLVITPQIVDDSDPTMPLNYGHVSPETTPGYPTGVQGSIPSSNDTKHADSESSARRAAPSSGIVTQLAHALGPWSNTQVPVSQEYPMQLHGGEHSPYGDVDTMLPTDSNHRAGIGSAASQEYFTNIQNVGLNNIPVDIEAEMLEIDWNLWDTVFPPQTNDGNTRRSSRINAWRVEAKDLASCERSLD